MTELLQAFAMIFIAEMGDKTQILAMAFATKYKVHEILLGVAIGSFLNHGLAIALGALLTQVVPIDMLQVIAGAAFLLFAMFSLTVDDEEEETSKGKKFGPVLTVALAFFVGELGDKTQLTALTLSTGASYPLLILAGTTLGMVATSMVGIFVGSRLGHKIPEFQLKLGAFSIFLFFGLQKLLTSPYAANVPLAQINIGLSLLAVLSFFRIRGFRCQLAQAEATRLARQADALHRHWVRMQNGLNRLCLGKEVCHHCDQDACLVGFMKTIVRKELEGQRVPEHQVEAIRELLHKDFDPFLASRVYRGLLEFYQTYPDQFEANPSHDQLRIVLELIVFNKPLSSGEGFAAYEERALKALGDVQPFDVLER